MLEVRIIGRFDIQCDGKPVIISSRVAQSLFAYLILHAGIPNRREKLAGIFWPDATEGKARAYLRHELWRIRKVLSPKSKSEYLVADDINVSFNASAEYGLDADALEKLSDTSSAEELMNVLSEYRGELLPGFYDEWIMQEREHLQAVYEKKMARLFEVLENEKQWQEMLDWAERWISFGHGAETAFRYMMTAYDALGDRARVTSTYQRCVQALRDLDLEPSEETRALAFKWSSKIKVPIPLTSFVGREKELSEVANLFSKSRLITLTGSGGVGKTRLAIQVVADVLEVFPDGVWFLDLAPLSDPALVPNVLANLLGLRESGDCKLSLTDLLINYLRSRTALVIFDNCEHLIESCAQLVNSLLTSCENLFVLATSREALRVSGEIPYRVPSLEVPKLDIEATIDALAKIESVRLFIERAAVASPGFAMSSQYALIIAQICRRLDGIPLAIELAAVRTNMLAVEQILKRLDDRFKLLTGGLRRALPRHQTLRATIEWSYDLLSEEERILFRRLAVFMGGWTLEAAEEVCTGDGIESADILDLLSQLISKSLIVVEFLNNGETRYPAVGSLRYRRLETIRQFGREKLFETAEAAHLQHRHLAYFLKFAEEIGPYLTGPEQSTWLDHLDLELDNIRLALEWSISNNRGEESLRLFSALGWFWYIRCHLEDGRKWFRRSIQVRDGTSKSAQANTLLHASRLYWALEDFASAKTILRESLDLYRELGNMNDFSHGLVLLGLIELSQGDLTQARKLFEEGLSVSRSVNDKPTMARALMQLGIFSQMEGDFVTAWQHHEESLAICRQIQDSHLTIVVLQSMGEFALEQKDTLKAREYYEETLAICRHLKNKRATAYSILGFASILCDEAQYTQSAQLQGFAETLFSESESLTEASFAQIRKAGDILKIYLGEDSYQKEFDIGKTLKLGQAVEIALKEQA